MTRGDGVTGDADETRRDRRAVVGNNLNRAGTMGFNVSHGHGGKPYRKKKESFLSELFDF